MQDPAFRQRYFAENLPIARAALAVGVVLVLVISIVDLFLMPEEYVTRVVPLRTGTMLVPMLAVVGASFLVGNQAWLPYLIAGVAVLIGGGSVMVGVVASQTGAPMVFGSAMYVIFNIYLVLGLTLGQSLICGWSVFAAYLGISLGYGIAGPAVTYGAIILGASNLVGAYAGFRLQHNAHEIFTGRRELKRVARIDALTGLYNRHTFDEHLSKVWRQARRDDKQVAVVIAAIDHFKLYNDCYGNPRGDKSLKAVAATLSDSISRPLDLIARYDGAQFALILFGPSLGFVESLTRGLCHKVVDLDIEHKASEVTPTLSLSVGASIAESAGNLTPEQLLRQADDALYEAQCKGRNQAVVYRTEWGQQTTSQLAAVLL